jgi:hypothetical protein
MRAEMSDTRRRLAEPEFEEATEYADPRAWATGDRFLYHKAMTDISDWRTYRSAGFRRLTRAQQTLLYWADFVGEVENGGLSQLYTNKPDIIDDVRAAIHALNWPELREQLDAAHFTYIAPSKNTEQWRKQLKKASEQKERELLKLWRAGIESTNRCRSG